MCDNDVACEAVECGETHCVWWKNNKCNDHHEFHDLGSGNLQTCVKNAEVQRKFFYVNIYINKIS